MSLMSSSVVNIGKRKGTLDSFITKRSKPSVSSGAVASGSNDIDANVSVSGITSPDYLAIPDRDSLNTSNSQFDISDMLSTPKSNIDNNLKYKTLTEESWKDLETYKFPSKKEGNKSRCFQLSWLKQHKWAAYSKKKDGVLCKHCFLFGKGTSHNATINILVTQPLTKWKKARELLKKHELSTYHQNSILDSEAFKKIYKNKSMSVQEMADSAVVKKAKENREKLNSIVKTIIFHGRQNIPLRGHREGSCSEILHYEDESRQGNFRALLKFRIDAGDTALKEHFNKGSKNALYISPKIQNELISICGDLIAEKIILDVKQSAYFSILCDETTDVSGIEQMSLSVRFLKNDMIVEAFLTFVPVTNTTGEILASVILDTVKKFGLDLEKLRGQGYDGAANMAGQFKGVQARILNEYPHAMYTHCCSHALNLVILTATDSTTASRHIKNMLGTMRSVITFLRDSTFRRDILKKNIKNDPDSHRLKTVIGQFCETRWIERHTILLDFIALFDAIVASLEEISELKPDSGAAALLHAILNADFITSMFVCGEISGLMLPVSRYLQKRQRDLMQAKNHLDALKATLMEKRESADKNFEETFKKAENLAKKYEIEMKLPRVCRRQTHRSNIEQADAKAYFKVNIYIPFLDHCISECTSRFGDHFNLVSQLQYVVPSFLVKEKIDIVKESLKAITFPDIESPMLQYEIEIWKKKWVKEEREVGNIPSCPLHTLPLCDSDLFPNIKKVLETLSVVPVTVAEGERSFSTLRRVKTWIRSTTSESRLNGLAMLNIHTEVPLSAEEVVERFSNSSNRRMDLII